MIVIKFIAFFFYLLVGAYIYWSGIPENRDIGSIFLMVWAGFSLIILFMPVERGKK